MPKGMVYLVGAGPGAPDLITLRGLACLKEADVILYDRLISPELLAHSRPGAQLIYAGKAPGCPTMPQDEINRLLVQHAQSGKVVCRLKGGDPFVLGRGGEEALALVEAEIPFQVVPGVTAAVAAPGAAGIPLTHRGIAHSFTVISGHRAGDSSDPTDWEAAARLGGTLVLLMSVGNLDTIARRLMAGGRSPESPAAIVQRGTLPDERVITGTLGTIAADAAAANVRPPAAVVVGDVVHLRDAIAAFRV